MIQHLSQANKEPMKATTRLMSFVVIAVCECSAGTAAPTAETASLKDACKDRLFVGNAAKKSVRITVAQP